MRVFLAFVLMGALHACVCWLYPILGTAAFLGTMTIIASEWADGCEEEVIGMVAAGNGDVVTEGGRACCSNYNSDADRGSDDNGSNDSGSDDSGSDDDSDKDSSDADDEEGDVDSTSEPADADSERDDASDGESAGDNGGDPNVQCMMCNSCCEFCGEGYCDASGTCQQVFCPCICRRCSYPKCRCGVNAPEPTTAEVPEPTTTEVPESPEPTPAESPAVEPTPESPAAEPSPDGAGDALATLAVAAWQRRYATRAGQKRK